MYRLTCMLFLLLLLGAVHGCRVSVLEPILESHPTPPPVEKAERWPSPSGELEVVVLTRNGGATVAYWTDVHVVIAGSEPQGEPLILASRVRDLDVAWTSDQKAVLKVSQAQVFRQKRECLVGEPPRKVGLDFHVPAAGRL